MVNDAGLTSRSITGLGASRGGRIMGVKTSIHNESAEVGGGGLRKVKIW